MFRRGKLVRNIILGAVVLVLAAFTAGFSYLMIRAFFLTDSAIGLNMSFTGYEYISIEATFVGVIVGAGYYVVTSALKRPMIEIAVEED
jgi:hypothetical protein